MEAPNRQILELVESAEKYKAENEALRKSAGVLVQHMHAINAERVILQRALQLQCSIDSNEHERIILLHGTTISRYNYFFDKAKSELLEAQQQQNQGGRGANGG
jgi:hypothetical protein